MTESYSGEVVRLALLAGDDATIRDAEFSDCQVLGPAVMILRSCEVENCRWDGDLDGILWEVPPTRQRVVGAMLVENCRFVGCHFSHVGVADGPEGIEQMREGFGG